jgi:hypothetical protein
MVDKLDIGPPPSNTTYAGPYWRELVSPIILRNAGPSMVGAITGILTSLTRLAAPIVVPIAASVVLAKWVHDAYKAP